MFTIPCQFTLVCHLNTAVMPQLLYKNQSGDSACKVTMMNGDFWPQPINSPLNGKWGRLHDSDVWLPWHSFKVTLARRDLPEFVAFVETQKSQYKTRRAWRRNRRRFTDSALAKMIKFDQQALMIGG